MTADEASRLTGARLDGFEVAPLPRHTYSRQAGNPYLQVRWSKHHAAHWLPRATQGDPEALYHLAVISERLGQHREAIRFHKRAAAATDPADAQWAAKSRRRLGSILWGQRWELALTRIKTDFDAGNFDAGIEAYRAAVDLTPTARTRLLGKLMPLLRSRSAHSHAEKAFRAALKLDPDDAITWDRLGSALSTKGDVAEAIEAYERTIASDPESRHPRRALAHLLQGQGQLEEAIDHFRKYVELAPNNDGWRDDAMRNAVGLMWQLGQEKEAFRLLQEWCEINRHGRWSREQLGAMLYAMKRHDAASDVLQALARSKSIGPKGTFVVALCAQHVGNRDEALAQLRNVLAKEPPNPSTSSAIADLLEMGIALERELEGVTDENADLVAEVKAYLAGGYVSLASRHGRRRDYGNAVRYGRKATQLDTQNGRSWGELGWWLYLADRPEEAMTASLKALELDDGLGYVYANVGLMHVLKRDLAQAIPRYERYSDLKAKAGRNLRPAATDLFNLLKKHPEIAEAHYALGFCY